MIGKLSLKMITSTECERGETCSTPSPLLQPVLGTDKRNPIFSVCRQGGIAPSLHVNYGAELLEVVSEDRQHPAYKLLVARLYNAGVMRERFAALLPVPLPLPLFPGRRPVSLMDVSTPSWRSL